MTEHYQRFLASKWFARRKNPRLRERLMRLNKNITEGELIRGWKPAPTLMSMAWQRDLVGKREFITKHGRAAWNKMGKSNFVKQGKRTYVRREAVLDRIWEDRPPRAIDILHVPPSSEMMNLLEDLKAEAINMMAIREIESLQGRLERYA